MRRIAFFFTVALVFTVPWQNVIVIEALGTFSRIVGFASVGVAGLFILLNKRIQEPSMVLIVMTLFVVWSFLSYFWSINPGATIGRVVTLVQLLAMVWLVWEFCKTHKDYMMLLQAYVFGCLVSISDMMVTFFTVTDTQFRIAAAGFNPNWLAITLATGIPVAWYLLIKWNKNWLIWINLLYIPLCVFAIILTASRGGFVTMFTALLVIPLTIFFMGQKIRRLVFVFSGISVLLLTLYLPQLYPRIEQNIERLSGTQTAIAEGNLSYREIIWQAGWQVFKEHPIIGVGARGFRYAVGDHLISGGGFAAHNAYLSVLIDTGLIGLTIFISLMLLALFPNLSLPPPTNIIFIVLLLTIIVGMIPANMEANKTIWCVLALMSAYRAFVIRNNKIVLIFKK